MRCRHQWKEVDSKFNPPNRGLEEVTGYREEVLLRCLYGITVIKQRCQKCGRIDAVNVIGEV